MEAVTGIEPVAFAEHSSADRSRVGPEVVAPPGSSSHRSWPGRRQSLDRIGIQEVGAFIDEGDNNFWGVEVWHDEHGELFVLASDRDHGLYVFQYTP